MKLLIRAPFIESERKRLETYFDEIVYDPWTTTGERYYEDEMLEVLKKEQPDALITELDRVTEKVLNGYDKLIFIGDCRANPANIDVEACKKANIPVLCTPARNAQAVAEMGNELCGKKVGFVGFGAVGKHAAKILEAYGCEISFYDPFVDFVKDSYKKCELEEIFKNSDIVSIHLPVLDSTKGMINADLFAKMKETAIFVNTARSAVVDEPALMEVLRNKKIRGAILDVLEVEPPTEEALEIARLDNVLLTPHICGATYEVTDHQSRILADRIDAWMKENK